MRELRYLAIADELRRRIAASEYQPGGLLASESQLAGEHGASRVTVRKALAELKRDGVIESRQGFGWYVATAPLRQSLRDLTTIERQIRAAGRKHSRELLRFAFLPTPARLTNLLETDSVLEIARVDRVDGQPFATATVWVRADLATGLSRHDLERRPLSEQLGVALGGATQVISAVSASVRDAELLHVPAGAPLVRCERTTLDSNGRAVLRSEALYNPLLTEFVAELPPSLQDADPAGLRLKPAIGRLQP
jgi:GntR family transcriptional regulator